MRLRLTPLLLAATLLASACDAAGDAVSDLASEAGEAVQDVVEDVTADPTSDDGGEAAPDGDGGEAVGGEGGGDGGGAATGPDDTGGQAAGGGGLATPLDDASSVGFHGPAMLRPGVQRLVVEVDVQDGVQPSQGALDHLVATMRAVVDKPGGVVLSGGNTFASDRDQWSTADLRQVAAQNRDTRSAGDTVSVYVLYVEGEFVSDGQSTNAIGVAHSASEMALFPQRWEGLGGLLGSDSAIERAVLVHEWGHLLGLVNIGYESEIDHEDPEHPGHSSNRGSVMYWAIESTFISQVFSGPPPDDFDQADLADLEGIRTGKYR